MTRFEFALQVLESGADLNNVSFYWDHWQDLTHTPSLVEECTQQSRARIEQIVHTPLRALWGRTSSPASLFKDTFEASKSRSTPSPIADRRRAK